MASLLTSNIRQGFCNLHDGDIHSRLMSALNPVLSQCLDLETMKYSFDAGSFNQLQGLEFNVDLPLRKQSGYLPEINLEKNRLQVHFPTEKMVKRIKFIKGSSYCTITASLLLFALKDGLRSKAVQQKQKLKLGKSDTGSSGRITFDCFVPDGCLCLPGIFLQYHNYKYMLNMNRMSPAAICFASVLPGDLEGENIEDWYKMGRDSNSIEIPADFYFDNLALLKKGAFLVFLPHLIYRQIDISCF